MFGCWQAVCLHRHEEECRGVRKTHWCTKSLFLMAAQAFFFYTHTRWDHLKSGCKRHFTADHTWSQNPFQLWLREHLFIRSCAKENTSPVHQYSTSWLVQTFSCLFNNSNWSLSYNTDKKNSDWDKEADFYLPPKNDHIISYARLNASPVHIFVCSEFKKNIQRGSFVRFHIQWSASKGHSAISATFKSPVTTL